MSEKVTLITGASSGIGASCAKLLSLKGKLVLAGTNPEKLDRVRGECQDPDNHFVWVCDFAKQRDAVFNDLKEIIKENDFVVENFVHCAGITQILPIKDFEIPYVDNIFNVNLFSAIEIIRALLKKVNQKGLKNIVMISALVSQRGDRCNSIYAASKGAINGLVYSLAQELAPIRVNAIMPGMVDTPMAGRVDENFREEIWNRNPLGKGKPEDIANYVDFLLSENARWITGQTAFVDGGQSTF